MGNELFKIHGSISVSNDDANEKIDDTTQKAEKGSSKLASFAKNVGKASVQVAKWTAAGIAAAATGISTLTKSSIESYADYEQLVGGAELMFGDAYQFIADKAKNAYATVQMSQNDYLEQVNGFAVGLKTALGGNEQAAAELADRIVTAEADVVAATGNSQEAVANAFNGIMKSNFTMLDNLQLGITPTKEGFQSVIDKVNEWNTTQGHATEYTIDNLADCQSALVDYIEMQGLAGYASNEGATTISGATASMKASWQNLLTAFASGEGTVGESIDALVGTIGNLADLVVPKITESVPQIVGGFNLLIQKLMPKIPEILNTLLPVLLSASSQLLQSLVALLPSLFSLLMDLFPDLLDAVVTLILMLVDMLPQIVQLICDALPTILPALIDAILTISMELIKIIPDIILMIIEALWESIPAIFDAVSEFLEELWTFIVELGQRIYDWLKPYLDDVSNILSECWQYIKNFFVDIWNSIKDFFINTWNSIKDAIVNIWNSIKDKATNVFNSVKAFFTNTWNSIKTSTVNTWNAVKTAILKPIETARDKIKDIVDKIKGFFTGMKLSFPSIKLPHFGITPAGWSIGDLLKGSIPKLGIEWYAKAMPSAMLLDKPTIFGQDSEGNLLGGGESGQEVVSGSSTLMKMIRTSVRDEIGNVEGYLNGILDVLSTYLPDIPEIKNMKLVLDTGTIVGEMMPAIDRNLGTINRMKGRGTN